MRPLGAAAMDSPKSLASTLSGLAASTDPWPCRVSQSVIDLGKSGERDVEKERERETRSTLRHVRTQLCARKSWKIACSNPLDHESCRQKIQTISCLFCSVFREHLAPLLRNLFPPAAVPYPVP